MSEAAMDSTGFRSCDKGVTLQHLKGEFLAEVLQQKQGKDAVVKDILDAVIMRKNDPDRKKDSELSYVDHIALKYDNSEDHCGPSSYMLSYTWSYKVVDIVGSLETYFQQKDVVDRIRRTKGDPEKTCIWICCLCINQWDVERRKTVTPDDFKQEFKTRVYSIRNVLAMLQPWNEPTYIKRVWCDFELFTAVTAPKEKDVTWELIMPPAETENLKQCLCSGHNQALRDVWKAVSEVNIEEAQASFEEDRRHIFELIEKESSFEQLNLVVSEALRAWVCSTSQKLLDEALTKNELTDASAASQIALVAFFLTELGGSAARKDAEALLDKGFKLKRSSADSLGRADLLAARGRLRCKQQQTHKAQMDFEEAASIRRHQRINEDAEMYRNMGITKKHKQEPDKALEYYEMAIKELAKGNLENSIQASEIFTNMGALYFDAWKDMDGAAECYLKALRIRNKHRVIETPKGGNLIMNFAVLTARRGDYDNAVTLFKDARTIFARTGRKDDKNAKYVNLCIAHLVSLSVFRQVATRSFRFGRSQSKSYCPTSELLRRCETVTETEVIKAFLDVCKSVQDAIQEEEPNSSASPQDAIQEEKPNASASQQDAIQEEEPNSSASQQGQEHFRYKVFLEGVAAAGKMHEKDSHYDLTSMWDQPEGREPPTSEWKKHNTDIKTMVWNITSPEYAANALEYMPDTSHDRWDDLQVLLEVARKRMFSPIANNQRLLKDIISEEALKKFMEDDGPENCVLVPTVTPKADQKKGLETWFRSRLRRKAVEAQAELRRRGQLNTREPEKFEAFRKIWVWEPEAFLEITDTNLTRTSTTIAPGQAPAAEDKAEKALEKWTSKLVIRWLKDPWERWKYWKEQSIYDWMRDDNSGGMVNPLLLAEEPAIDSNCWDLGLSTADREYAADPRRLARARWLSVDKEEKEAQAPRGDAWSAAPTATAAATAGACVASTAAPAARAGPGSPPSDASAEPEEEQPSRGTSKHDFFKLLVWDMIIEWILQEATRQASSKLGKEAIEDLLKDLRPAGRDKKFAALKQLLQPRDHKEKEVDLAILCEVPAGDDLTSLEGIFLVGRAKEQDKRMNTVVLARRSVFDRLELGKEITAPDDRLERRVSSRAISCKLYYKQDAQKSEAKDGKSDTDASVNGDQSAEDVQVLHVLAVHLASNGYDWEDVAPQLEPLIDSNTVLAGDFNCDLRKSRWPSKVQKAVEATPQLRALLEQARQLPTGLGSCCKQRMPFQTQVSKAFHQDFTMKDFVFLGPALRRSDLKGLIRGNQRMPNQDIPSDHAPIRFRLAFQSTVEEEEDANNIFKKVISKDFMEKIGHGEALDLVNGVLERILKEQEKAAELASPTHSKTRDPAPQFSLPRAASSAAAEESLVAGVPPVLQRQSGSQEVLQPDIPEPFISHIWDSAAVERALEEWSKKGTHFGGKFSQLAEDVGDRNLEDMEGPWPRMKSAVERWILSSGRKARDGTLSDEDVLEAVVGVVSDDSDAVHLAATQTLFSLGRRTASALVFEDAGSCLGVPSAHRQPFLRFLKDTGFHIAKESSFDSGLDVSECEKALRKLAAGEQGDKCEGLFVVSFLAYPCVKKDSLVGWRLRDGFFSLRRLAEIWGEERRAARAGQKDLLEDQLLVYADGDGSWMLSAAAAERRGLALYVQSGWLPQLGQGPPAKGQFTPAFVDAQPRGDGVDDNSTSKDGQPTDPEATDRQPEKPDLTVSTVHYLPRGRRPVLALPLGALRLQGKEARQIFEAPRQEVSVLLLSNPGRRLSSWQPADTQKANAEPRYVEEDAWPLADVEALVSYFRLTGCEMDVRCIISADLKREDCQQRIRAFLSAKKQGHRVLAYIGCGGADPESGYWGLSDEKISTQWILETWDQARPSEEDTKLLIFADCDNSGRLVEEAAKKGRGDVLVQSSCASQEQASNGRGPREVPTFTRLFAEAIRDPASWDEACSKLDEVGQHPCFFSSSIGEAALQLPLPSANLQFKGKQRHPEVVATRSTVPEVKVVLEEAGDAAQKIRELEARLKKAEQERDEARGRLNKMAALFKTFAEEESEAERPDKKKPALGAALAPQPEPVYP